MSSFKDKSEVYKEAAVQLNKSGLYAPVGHTAYYSCFLFMEHIRCFSESFSSEEYEVPVFEGSHEKLINEIRQYIQNKNKNDSIDFQSHICDLKRFRSSADYKDESFPPLSASRSLGLMNIVLELLKKHE